MKNSYVMQKLDDMGACSEGRDWAEENGGNLYDLWDACPRGDWMAWYIGEDRRLRKTPELLKALIDVAEYTLKKAGKESVNREIYKSILNEVKLKAYHGADNDETIEELEEELRQRRPYDGSLERLFTELADAVDSPMGAYAVPDHAADAVDSVKGGDRDKALKHFAKIFRKYFRVGLRGLTTVKVDNG
ncbi:MAG TPA: hypothetical protein VIY48_01640 [Candidatus Paceibacterota bacterium]